MRGQNIVQAGLGRRWALSILSAFIMLAFLAPAAPAQAATGIHDDLKEALAQANKSGRLLLVDFYGDWCPWCVKMDQTLADPDVKATLDKRFFYYKLDVGRFDKHVDCIKQYKVEGIPFLAVFNADGSVRLTQDGYMNAAACKTFLDKAAAETPTSIHPDLQDALNKAKKAGKILLVDFYGDWCPWCVKMDETLADPDVKALLDKQFLYYKLDVGRFDKHTDCVKQYKVEGIPRMIAFDSTGDIRAQHSGYMKAPDFLAFLRKTAETPPAKLTTLDFARFKDQDDAIVAAVSQSAGLKLRLIVYFYSDKAPEHAPMEALLAAINDDAVSANFAVLRIPQSENAVLARLYGCSGAPFLIVFRPSGAVSTSYIQEVPTRDDFLAALHKAATQE